MEIKQIETETIETTPKIETYRDFHSRIKQECIKCGKKRQLINNTYWVTTQKHYTDCTTGHQYK